MLRHEDRSREVKLAPSMAASAAEYKPNLAGGGSYIIPEKSGQVRPYVRPVARQVPLAIMGVRLRVRHQSAGRARSTTLRSVLPELP
jgi:hypothetical protein